MRIIKSDPILGVSKVVWKFSQEAEPELKTAPVESTTVEEVLTAGSLEWDQQTEPEKEEDVQKPECQQDHMEDLRSQIRFLQQVIESQNHQLKTKDELIRNFQVLLKNEQEQVMKLGPAPETNDSNKPENQADTWWFGRLKRKWSKHSR